MAQEALAHPGGLWPGAAPAQPGRGGGGGGDRGGGRRLCRLGRRGAVVCACDQWSRSHPQRATLVRHVLLEAITAVTAGSAALAPALRPRGVGKPAAAGSLVSARALAPSGVARQAPARPATVAIATVAVAAQHDLGTATRAQEQAGWSIHAHPGREPKVQCWTDASQQCHTDAAPPSSARCRARYGRCASRLDSPLPRPPSSAWALLYPERPSWRRPVTGLAVASSTTRPPPGPTATGVPDRRIARVCLAALQGGQADNPLRTASWSISLGLNPTPHQRIDAVLDQRSQRRVVTENY